MDGRRFHRSSSRSLSHSTTLIKMAKKKASKSASGSSKKPSLSPYPDDLDAHGEPDGDATMSSFPGSRATSPAASIVSTSGSEDNPDIKDFYADAGDINVVPLICKWALCGEVQSDLQCLLDHVHEGEYLGSVAGLDSIRDKRR